MFFILFIYLSSIPDGTHYLPLPQLGNGSPVHVVQLLRHSGHTYAPSNKWILSPLQGSKQTREPDAVWIKSWIPASMTGKKHLTWASARHCAAQGDYPAPDLFQLSWILLCRPCPLYHSLVSRNFLEEMVTWPCYLYVRSLLPLTLHCLQWNPSSLPWAS